MAPTNPRIIVADDRDNIYNIVKTSLELLDRHPRLIHVHTGEDAMIELSSIAADLLVTTHSLNGASKGVMLALTAKRELAALPVIVLADATDSEMDEETLSQSPFQYLRRPFMPEAFLRALRIALDGPEAVPSDVQPEDIMGPVPAVDNEKLRPVMFRLMREAGAMAVILADRNGKVIAFEGAAGYIDRDLLAAALGPGFGSTTKLLSIVGDRPRVLKYYAGEKSDMFGLSVGLHHFLTLVYDGNAPNTALATVKREGGIAVNQMLTIIGEPAFTLKPLAVVALEVQASAKEVSKPDASPHRRGKRATTGDMAAVVQKAPSKVERIEKTEREKTKMPVAAPIANFNPDLFDSIGSVDMDAADAMFSPENLAANLSRGNGNQISFEDALHQGILGDMSE